MKVRIPADSVFDRPGLAKHLGIKLSTLSRETRLGRLRPSWVSGRALFTGESVMAWLKLKAESPETADDDDMAEMVKG